MDTDEDRSVIVYKRQIFFQPVKLFLGDGSVIVTVTYYTFGIRGARSYIIKIDDIIKYYVMNLAKVIGIVVGPHGIPEFSSGHKVGTVCMMGGSIMVMIADDMEMFQLIEVGLVDDFRLVIGYAVTFGIPVVVP